MLMPGFPTPGSRGGEGPWGGWGAKGRKEEKVPPNPGTYPAAAGAGCGSSGLATVGGGGPGPVPGPRRRGRGGAQHPAPAARGHAGAAGVGGVVCARVKRRQRGRGQKNRARRRPNRLAGIRPGWTIGARGSGIMRGRIGGCQSRPNLSLSLLPRHHRSLHAPGRRRRTERSPLGRRLHRFQNRFQRGRERHDQNKVWPAGGPSCLGGNSYRTRRAS